MQPSLNHDELRELAAAFGINADIKSITVYGRGHINETLLVEYGSEKVQRFVHQRINQLVFKQPELVMQNIARVTKHLRAHYISCGVADYERRSLHLLTTTSGEFYWRSPKGEVWRSYDFVDNTKSYQTVSEPRLARSVGAAFGEFLRIVSFLPGEPLHDTIAKFHDTRRRYENFVAVLRADEFSRAELAQSEIEFVTSQEHIVDYLMQLQRSGEIKGCVTHNDTKLNNVLFDRSSDQALCVVDLDTVMPGQALFDFGDMVRSSTCFAPEDALDLNSVRCEPELFEALAAGFVEQTEGILSEVEKDNLVFSGILITFEIGMRFLTDFLAGDTYFKIERKQHNLERARAQFALARSIIDQRSQLEQCVAKLR